MNVQMAFASVAAALMLVAAPVYAADIKVRSLSVFTCWLLIRPLKINALPVNVARMTGTGTSVARTGPHACVASTRTTACDVSCRCMIASSRQLCIVCRAICMYIVLDHMTKSLPSAIAVLVQLH